MRLIDADALCEGLASNHPVVIYAKSEPTVDAVPVVRCKDCKNSRGKIANRTKCGLHNWWVVFDYFCADGERKNDV